MRMKFPLMLLEDLIQCEHLSCSKAITTHHTFIKMEQGKSNHAIQ